jgi:HK97 gp10 family phage protein
MNLTSFSRYQPRSGAGQFIEAKITQAVTHAITEWAERVLATAQVLVPVDTGALRESGHVEVSESGKTVYAAVVFDSPHSVFVEFGTGIRGAASPGAGPGPYSPTWPGMPAQPYLRPAFDEWRAWPVAMVEETVTVALTK